MSLRKAWKSCANVLGVGALCLVAASCASPGWTEAPVPYIGPAQPDPERQSTGSIARPSTSRSSIPATQTPAPPDGALEITVGDAILLALENNPALSVERLTPLIRETVEGEERAVFDPTLQAGASASRERVRAPSRTTGAITDTRTSRTEASLGISEFFPTGTDVSIALTTDRDWSMLYSDQHATRVGFTVTQALMRGAGLEVNLASLRQARLDSLSSRYELRGFAEALVADVETTYWNHALARRRIDIFEQSLELAEKQFAETRERVEVGTLAETELAAAQAEMALRKEALIDARSNLAAIRLRLVRLLGVPGDGLWERDVVLKNEPAVPDAKLDDVDAHIAVAQRMRTDLNQARLSAQRGDLELVKTKNGLLPQMDLFISLGKTGYADSFGASVRGLDAESYDVSAGIDLEFPVGNRRAQSRHRRAVLTRGQIEQSIQNLNQLVQMDVRSAYIEVHRASEQIAATEATRRFQEEKLRAETEKFRVGKSTSLLVAQAQRDLVDSRISEIQAVVNYLNSLVDLFRLEGSLLERRGISAPGREPAPMPSAPDRPID